MLLNSQERDFKARVWTNLNKQWLVEQKEKKRIKKQEIKARKALKTTHSFASSSQMVSEPQSPTSKFSSPETYALGKKLSSVVQAMNINLNQIPAKKRNIVADSAADALKQRYPEINEREIDQLFDQTT